MLRTYSGEPHEVDIPDDIEVFTQLIWTGIDDDNKVALYVRFVDPTTMEYTDRLINKNE